MKSHDFKCQTKNGIDGSTKHKSRSFGKIVPPSRQFEKIVLQEYFQKHQGLGVLAKKVLRFG